MSGERVGSFGSGGSDGPVRPVGAGGPGGHGDAHGLYAMREGGPGPAGDGLGLGGEAKGGVVGVGGGTDGAVDGAERGADAGTGGVGSRAEGSGDGAEEGSGGRAPGEGSGSGSGDSLGSGDGLGFDDGLGGFRGGFGGEDALRRLLHSRVGDLEPAPDALEQLRRAVPARRQRRRHVVVGAAAALLLGGTSIPAMVQVVSPNDGSEDRPANAASSQRAQDGFEGEHGEGTEHADPPPSGEGGRQPGSERPAGSGKKPEKGSPSHAPGAATPAPDATMEVSSPICGREQLGQGTASVRPADSEGRVYGAFRMVNTSTMTCSVEGGGTVSLVAQGSTNPDHVHVVDHTSGDDATGLPDPANVPDQLVLKPGEAYEVKFAWIPEEGGGTTGCATPGTTAPPAPSQTPGDSPDSGSTTGGDGGQTGGDDGAGDGGSTSSGIVLTHTPEAGEPAAADAKIADACAGTVYHTEALATR